MHRKHLAATVAAGPLIALAFAAAPLAARAQVQITTATTTPVATATASNGAPADITVTATGSITPTVAGPIITLNSNNAVSVAGPISTKDVDNSIGVLVQGGRTGSVNVSSSISIASSLEPPDNDKDGDADGPLANGSGRTGIKVDGPGVFTGNITVVPGGSVLVSGNGSTGISINTPMVGTVLQSGTLNTTGDGSIGVYLSRSAPLTGNLRLQGTTDSYGLGSVGAQIDGDITGSVAVQGSVTASGFRYQTRPGLDTDRAKLDPDDLLIGGPALRVTGNVTGGVVLDVPPALTDTTVDANKDGTLDYLVADTDGDGVADVNEGSASITSYGSAPALWIGSDSRAITLGPVGTGANAYGLINRGTITADGLFDGISSTAMMIGAPARGGGNFATNIANGIYNSGQITANAYVANATAINLLSGANAPAFINAGTISAATTSSGANTARALTIQAGATLNTLTNSGSIAASSNGGGNTSIAIEDLAGGLSRIDNTGLISAGIVNTTTTATTGKAIAIDARANTTGLTINQAGAPSTTITQDSDGDGVNDASEPGIYGDVLFGSGADRLLITNGTLNGAMSFGAGADVLNISGGATVIGALTDGDGKLDITLGKGALAIQNAATINATSLNVTSADSQLLFSADPTGNSATKLVVGSASLASNAQVSMTLSSILDAPARYVVVQAGSLTAGTLRSSVVGAPYLYVSSASANTALGQVYVDVRPRTSTELGFNSTQAGAYGAVIQALKNDTALARPLLVQTGREGLVRLYDQLLPDLGQGTFDALAYSAEQIAQGIAIRPDPYERYGPDSFWAQEVNSLVRTETAGTMGSDTQVFGFAGGYEAMGEYGGALGVAVAYMNVQERDNAAQVGERTTASVVQGDLYWRRSVGGLRLSLGGGGGYGWFNGQRRFFSGDLNGDNLNDLERDNRADWNGLLGHAFGSVAYEATVSRYFARPELRLDYLYLREGERKESGGGAGFDLLTRQRTSSALNAMAAMTFGASFGHDIWWRPEVRVGYRQQIAGSMGDTVASFAGGTPFTLASANNTDGAVTLDMALRAGTPMSYVAIEGGVAAAKRTKRYNVRLAGRMMF